MNGHVKLKLFEIINIHEESVYETYEV